MLTVSSPVTFLMRQCALGAARFGGSARLVGAGRDRGDVASAGLASPECSTMTVLVAHSTLI